MFIQNEYIVFLRDPGRDTKYLKHGYCFVQNENKSYFSTNKDLIGTSSAASSVSFGNKSLWRYATPEEIAEYDRLGKPFDVTTLRPKEFSKEELLEEAKRRYPVGTYFKSPDDGYKIREVKPYTIGSNITWFWSEEIKGTVIRSLSGLFCRCVENTPACSNPHVYKDGIWAEIVSKPESVEKMEEPKFIVGKWYKRTTAPTSDEFVMYIKCCSINPIKDCENITFGGKHTVSVLQGRGYKQWKVLEDLSEIQQYLPEGHPDKFPVSKELASLPEKWVVRNPRSEESEKLYAYANVHGATPPYTNGTLFHFPSHEGCTTRNQIAPGYTEITFNQFKKWVLKESSEVSLVGRYLKAVEDYPQCTPLKIGAYEKIVTKINDEQYKTEKGWTYTTNNLTAFMWEVMPEGFTPPLIAPVSPLPSSEIPEYVECLKDYPGQFTKGRIYETSIKFGSVKFDDTGNSNAWSINCFKPSSKEAFEARQNPQPSSVKPTTVEPEWIPQVGEWVKCIGDLNCTSNHSSVGWEKDLVFKITRTETTLDKLIAFGGKGGNGVWVFESNLRKALPHEIPSECGPGIIHQIESVKDYGVLTEEKLGVFVSDLFYTPSELSPKVDTALPMISFVIPPREI
jgi:hypothetical protein